MRTVYCIMLALLFVLEGCKNEFLLPGIPDCIKEWITNIKAEPVWNPPAQIFRFSYNGKIVYYIPQRCCDIPSLLLDESCNYICSPDGGIGGGGDGRCSDFFTNRSNGQLVWKDDRN